MAFIKLLLEAVSSVFGFLKLKTELVNSPEIKQAVKAQNEIVQTERVNDAIEKRDTKSIEKELSE